MTILMSFLAGVWFTVRMIAIGLLYGLSGCLNLLRVLL